MTVLLALAAATSLLGWNEPRIEAITAAPAGPDIVIRVSLTEPAALPEAKLLEAPWRLYFDLPGVRPGAGREVDVMAGGVSRIRLALNQPAPPVTRVVVDLTGAALWRVEPGATPREFLVIVSGDSVAAATGATGTSGVTAPVRGVVSYIQAAPPAPATDRRERITMELLGMAGVVEMMRAWTGPSDAGLAELIAATRHLAEGARAMQITGSAHDRMLVAAIDAVSGAAAARAQALADGTAQSRANAITAATGALLLIESARNVDGKL